MPRSPAELIAHELDSWDDSGIKAETIDTIRRDGGIQEVINLLLIAFHERGVNRKVATIETLARIPEARDDPKVIKLLIQAVPDGEFRNHSPSGFYADADDQRSPGQLAAELLGEWNVREAIPALVEQLSRRPIEQPTIACIRALARMKAEEALPELEALTHSDAKVWYGVYSVGSYDVRSVAERAISQIRSAQPETARRNEIAAL